MIYKAPIRSRYAIKKPVATPTYSPAPQQNLGAGMDQVFQLVQELIDLKEQFVKVMDEKIAEADQAIAGVGAAITHVKTITKGDPGRRGNPGKDTVDEMQIALQVMKMLPPVQHGKTPTQAEIEAIIKPLIPKIKQARTPVKGIDYSDGKNADPDTTANLVLEKLKGKILRPEHIEGLEQTLSAIRNQTRKGYLHGSGVPSISAGSGIVLTPTADGGYQITSTGGSGESLVTETPTPAANGSQMAFTVAHIPTFVNADGQVMTDGNGYTRSGLTLTFDNAPQSILQSFYNTSGSVTLESLVGTQDGINAIFTVSNTPVFINNAGQLMTNGNGYTLAGLTITFDSAPPTSPSPLQSFYN